jgi:hypothetical protein
MVGYKMEEGDWNPGLNAVVISSKEFRWKHAIIEIGGRL